MEKNIKVSICIPVYLKMKDAGFMLGRCIDSIAEQTYKNIEVIMTTEGSISENTNNAIKRATGDIIKIMYMDDYFSHKDALKTIVEAFKGYWLVNGTDDNLKPYYTGDIIKGNNKLGSPSALTIRNNNPLLFDENTRWLLDCDYYQRMYDMYGEPTILEGNFVTIGKHEGQATNVMTNNEKDRELLYLIKKYEHRR